MAIDNFAENIRDKSPPVTDPEVLAVALSNIGTMSPRLRKLYDDSTAALRSQAVEIQCLREFAQWMIDSYHSDDGMPPAKDVVREARAVLGHNVT